MVKNVYKIFGKDPTYALKLIKDNELLDIRRNKISMVFQSFTLMPHMNIIDNVSFGLDLSGIKKEERYEKAKIALDQVGLIEYIESYPMS